MNNVTVGVVENEMVIADTICLILRKLGYEVLSPAPNYNKALQMIEQGKPDLLLLDINLGGPKDGIDVAQFVRANYSMPIIFLTANSDMSTVQRAKQVKPNAYLVKPFTKEDLYSAIEIAIANFSDAGKNEKSEFILVKDGYDFIKVCVSEILFINSDHNYVTIHLKDTKKIMMRSTMQEMQDRLPESSFVRINRGLIVNVKYLTKVESEKVFMDTMEFPVTKAAHESVVNLLRKTV